jgi:hypothetical protein
MAFHMRFPGLAGDAGGMKKRPGKKPGQVQQGGCRAITPTRPGELAAQPVHVKKVAIKSGNNKP